MKIERTRNSKRGILFGILLRVYQLLVPFLIRTVIIYYLGVEYLGLNSLFTSVLGVLSLAELGVSTAMVFSMYKPIAEDDTKAICALLQLYKTYYRIIGTVIGVIGLILLPFIPNLIHGDVPADLNIYILYLLQLTATVLSYWLFAYKASLFHAHQRPDVVSKVGLISSTFQYCLQILALLIWRNYYLYAVVSLLALVLNNLVMAAYANKAYPEYQPKGNPEEGEKKRINRKIRDLFTSKLGYVVNNSVDSVFISVFLGLKVLGIYNNYYYIMNAVMGFLVVVFDSVTAGIGNSLITESREKNFDDLKKFTFIIFWISNFCVCCMLCLYQPFMRIWVGEELMLEFGHVVLLALMFWSQTVRKIWVVVKDAAGVWHQDRYRPLITAGVNLVVNFILVHFIGLYGIMLSTVLAECLVSIPWVLRTVFKYVLPVEHKAYLVHLTEYIGMLILSSVACVGLCNLLPLPQFADLAVYLLVCAILSNGLQYIAFRKTFEFRESGKLALAALKRSGQHP